MRHEMSIETKKHDFFSPITMTDDSSIVLRPHRYHAKAVERVKEKAILVQR